MNNLDIKSSLCKIILIAGSCLAIFSIVGNYFSDFPLEASLKWAVLFVVCISAYTISRNLKYLNLVMFAVYFFIIWMFLPFAFLDSGGSDNNAIGYIFLLLITITYIFQGWKRIFFFISLMLVFVILHIVEYYFPGMVSYYSEWKQFLDRLIQIPVLLYAAFMIILKFAKEYELANKKLEKYAVSDELTGLFNRRKFNSIIEEIIENQEKSVHIALIDLDNFKRINDKHGHHTGDIVLKKLAEFLMNYVDISEHVICRWGGDEFTVIYYGEKSELMSEMENVKKAFGGFVEKYQAQIGMSLSIVSFDDFDDAYKALEVLDQKLYKEKNKKEKK